MKSLPVLSVAAILVLAWICGANSSAQDAQPAGDAPQAAAAPSSSAAAATLAQARQRLLGHRSVRAKIRERVLIGDRQFTAEGQYVQGPDLKLRLEYEVKLGRGPEAFEGSLLQVCDGQVLWSRYLMDEGPDSKTKPTPRITRRDVQLILDTAAKVGAQNRLVTHLGLGGLPALLAALEANMTFDSQQPAEDGNLTMISGKWKDQFLAQLPKDPKDSSRLADYIPDAVRVYLDRENLFPRRILFLKRPPQRDQLHPMVSLDFVEVTLNGPVKDEEFQYIPPDGVFPVNITDQYLRELQAAATNAANPQPQGNPPAQGAGAAAPAGSAAPTGGAAAQPAPAQPAEAAGTQ